MCCVPLVSLTAKLGPEATRNGRSGTSNLNMSHSSPNSRTRVASVQVCYDLNMVCPPIESLCSMCMCVCMCSACLCVFVCFCVFLCVCNMVFRCTCAYRYVCLCFHMKVRGQPWIPSSGTFHTELSTGLLRQGLSLARSPADRLDIESQGSICLCLSSTRITTCAYLKLLMWVLRTRLGSFVCEVRPVEPSPQFHSPHS